MKVTLVVRPGRTLGVVQFGLLDHVAIEVWPSDLPALLQVQSERARAVIPQKSLFPVPRCSRVDKLPIYLEMVPEGVLVAPSGLVRCSMDHSE